MAFYQSTSKMDSSEVQFTEQELLHQQKFPPRMSDVILEDEDYHLLSCSFEKPCLFCDDKYSTPDPVYCYGVLMGGIRRGKPGIPTPNYMVSCEKEHHNNKKLLSQEFSRMQEDDANHDHQDVLSCSHDNPSAGMKPHGFLRKLQCQLLLIFCLSHCFDLKARDSKIPRLLFDDDKESFG